MMIIDINDNEWIIRFKGKKISFRTYRAFTRLIAKITISGQTTLRFDLGGVREIDPSSLGMFLQLFQALDPELHKVSMLNATPELQTKLDDLFKLIDVKAPVEGVEAQQNMHASQLFNKVLRARSSKIRQQHEQEERFLPPDPLSDSARKKKLMVSYLKFPASATSGNH
ncbi:MAG: STAS domain-containing protein [Magnetococcales bacterium]|nr:STAS domain-containing protein [Magnetococcales bacterium]